MSYEEKYKKYKNKYLKLKELSGGGTDNFLTYEFKDGVLSIKKSYTDTITKQNIEDIIKNKIITTVEIDISFTKIDDYAFANMNIQNIKFMRSDDINNSSKLKSIGKSAFMNNIITKLELPKHKIDIGEKAFVNNEISTYDKDHFINWKSLNENIFYELYPFIE